MTSDNGNENTPRREAMTGRGDIDPLVHRHAQDARATGPGTPADPAVRDPGEAPGGGEVPGGTGSRETANPSRSTADGTRTMPADDRDTRAGQGADMRAGQQKAMRAMQPDSARAGQQESARAGQGGPTSAGQPGTGPQGEGDGALLSHDACDKYALRMQHAVGGFVDGPRASVEEADHVLEELTTEFTDAMTRRRRNLRTTWQAAGESDTADTEKLRLALRDYREVTERLLHL
ncbi:hypothetical protein [Streptomyces mirabilis]|uniref:hypothetical protein n=1 Tax=Streptomyces mirabilis TaxID=68239 RepID=UPI00224EE044|nr:hypothetical protein [Streptomyces mirabilis]MCX4424536.1 hypothetical protein [Streptomyces mirabilis]